MLNLKQENVKLLTQMQNGIVNLKACIDNQHVKEHIRNTSTPKIRCEKRKSSCNPGQKFPYQVHLQSDGNLKKGKTQFVAAKIESKPLRSIIRCKKTPSNHRARFSPRESRKHVVNSDKLDKSMMGYDWIAGCLDNDSYINEQSDQFFQDIEEFRRLNRDECKTAVKDIDISPKDTSKLITVSSQPRKENYPLCCNGKGAYMLNNRLNLIPIHGPYSECPTCQLKKSCRCENDSNYVRVSIPRSTLSSPYRLQPHRRKSYDPSDSVALSTHCLAGWQNSKPAYAPGPTNVDLASHASATGLTSVILHINPIYSDTNRMFFITRHSNIKMAIRALCISLILVAFLCATKCAKQKKAKESTNIQLEQKIQALSELNNRRPVIRMNGDKFRQYVKSSPRNYSIIIMLTALAPQRQCGICKEVNGEYQILASSWKYSNGFSGNKLFFAMVDFDEGSDIFQSLKLNSAPVIMHFPARGRQRKGDTYDMSRTGFAAEQIARWVHERTDITIRVVRPPNYFMAITIGVLLAGIGALLYVKRKSIEVVFNKDYWAVIAVTIALIMISGQMWNHIRSPPYAHRNPQTGEIAYIHGSSDGQLIAETYIVFGLYACICIGFVFLNEKAMEQDDLKKKRIFTVIGFIMIIVFFSLILSIFRNKYHGYPYSFLFK